MLFPQESNTTAKGPKYIGMGDNKHDRNGCVNLLT